MLSFESRLSNTFDGDDDLSGFLLGLATSRARSTWFLGLRLSPLMVASADNPLLASISRLLRHAGEHSGSILLTPNSQRAPNLDIDCTSHEFKYLVFERLVVDLLQL